jgi:hypothetical protein
MGRFDRIHTPRLQVEGNLPGFDVRRSVAAAAKRVQRNRQQRVQTPAPQVQPEEQVIVQVSLGETGQPDLLSSAQAAAPKPFAINL